VAIDYMQMLLNLMEERQKWAGQRDAAIREISRLSELIRATVNMIPPEQLARYEPIFERLEKRPAGLSMAIRACFTGGTTTAGFTKTAEQKAETGKPEITNADPEENAWLTPVQIRDSLKHMGFPFENYKANPLASIHTTLKRMVPGEVETKTLADGQKVYRLKCAGEWSKAFAEAREWVKGNFEGHMSGTSVVVAKRTQQAAKEAHGQQEKQKDPTAKGAKRGTAAGA